MEHMEQIKNLILENQEILSRFIKEIQDHNVSLETIEQEVRFLKDLHRQLSLLVRDDADNSILIRVSRLEGSVEEFHHHLEDSVEKDDDADKKAGNNRSAVIIALIASLTSLLSQILEAIFGKH